MKVLPFLTFGLIIIFNISAFGREDWKEFKSHNFKIEFYQTPEYSTDTSQLDNSPIISHYWEANTTDTLHENTYYSVSLVSYPSDFIHSDSLFSTVEGFINSTQNDLLEDDSFTLLTSWLTETQGFPGKEFRWKNNATSKSLRIQVFLVESTLFQLSVVSKEGKNHNIFINKFFDSFEVINTPHGNFSVPEITTGRTFQINFPEEPINNSKTVDSEYGKLELDIQTLEPSNKKVNFAYVAMETKYPTQVVDQNDSYSLNSFYRKSIDGSIAAVNGELISITDIYYNDNLGKEFKCYFSEGKALMVYKVFYIKTNLYMIGVITSPDKDNNKEMKDFFESFKIKA